MIRGIMQIHTGLLLTAAWLVTGSGSAPQSNYSPLVLQQRWCGAISENEEIAPAVSDIAQTGGWFAIRALRGLLDPAAQTNFERAQKKAPATDVGHAPPRSWALEFLREIVADGPITLTTPRRSQQEEARIWIAWIDAHAADLSKREPTGEGVDFSVNACKPQSTVRETLPPQYSVGDLQKYWCEAIREDRAGAFPILLPFRQIGGWYGIKALSILLTPEAQRHFERAAKKEPPSDVVLVWPMYLAIEILPDLIPEADVRLHFPRLDLYVDKDKQVQFWRDWISSHQAELRERWPTGTGVDFSDRACNKDGTVRKKR